MTDHPTAPVRDDDAEIERLSRLNPMYEGHEEDSLGLNIRMHVRAIASRLSPTPETDQQAEGASLRDRAGRPPDQAPAGLGDTATIPSAEPRQ